MQKGYIAKYTVGDLYAMAQATDQPSTTDLSGRTGFGWTGVPIVIAGPNGEIDYEVDYVPARDGFEDHIQLVPKRQVRGQQWRPVDPMISNEEENRPQNAHACARLASCCRVA